MLPAPFEKEKRCNDLVALFALAFLGAASPLAPLGAATVAAPPPRGFFAAGVAEQLRIEREFRALPDPAVARETIRQLAAAPHHVGSAQGGKNAEWILARFHEWGLDARIETFQVLFPTPRERVVELVAPDSLPRVARRDAARGRSDDRPDGPAAPDLQRVLRRRRRHRAARLRQLRRPGRLRAARAARRRRQGQDRDRPLRRRLARHQAEGRGREGRGRLHHLLRPAGRRLLRRARSTPRARSARRRASSAGASRTCPSTPAIRSRRGSAPPKDAKRLDRSEAADDHEDPGAADLLRGRAAAARRAPGSDGARGVARRAADHLPRRPRPGDRPSQGACSTGGSSRRATSSRRIPGAVWPDEWVVRGNHHDAWVNGAEDPISGLAAMLEEARAYGAMLEEGLAAEAHDHALRLGRGGGGAPRLDRVGRDPRRRAPRQGGRLHQHRRQRPRLPGRGRVAHSGAARLGGRGGGRGPAEEDHRARPRAAEADLRRVEAGGPAEGARPLGPSRSRRSDRARTSRRFSSTSGSRR